MHPSRRIHLTFDLDVNKYVLRDLDTNVDDRKVLEKSIAQFVSLPTRSIGKTPRRMTRDTWPLEGK
jgi:hypothetical protein